MRGPRYDAEAVNGTSQAKINEKQNETNMEFISWHDAGALQPAKDELGMKSFSHIITIERVWNERGKSHCSGVSDPWLHYAHSSIAIPGDLDNRIRLLAPGPTGLLWGVLY